MCKIALFNRSFYEKNPAYVNVLLKSLVRECGGHGNGFGMLYPNGEVQVAGGWKMSVDEITTEFAVSLWDETDLPEWYVFHTRLATTAPLYRDDLCQPFYDVKSTLAMAHVGTVHTLDIWSIKGEAVSDGRMLFELGSKYSDNPPIDFYRSGGGHFAGFYKGLPYVVTDWSLYRVANVTDNAVCFHTGRRNDGPDGYTVGRLKTGVYVADNVEDAFSFSRVFGYEEHSFRSVETTKSVYEWMK